MLKSTYNLIKEQTGYIELILRMAIFETKGTYQIHYLGTLWQIINPALQIGVYWFVFGLGIRDGRPVGDTPFFVWLLIGLIPWFFISPSMIQGSNSIHQKVSMVSKMNFPVSILPTIRIVSNSFQFIVLMIMLSLILMLYGVFPTIYLIQLPYYLLCLYVFVFAFSIISSTISTLVRDYQMFLQSMMRMLLYLSPILWDPSSITHPLFVNVVKLNPLYYILEGIRGSILGNHWVTEDIVYTLYFWAFTLSMLLIGSKIHMKFRKNFVDYL